jgi:hypothetical protein
VGGVCVWWGVGGGRWHLPRPGSSCGGRARRLTTSVPAVALAGSTLAVLPKEWMETLPALLVTLNASPRTVSTSKDCRRRERGGRRISAGRRAGS